MEEYAASRHPSLHVDTASARAGEPYPATSTPALRHTSRQPEPSWISGTPFAWTQSPTPSRAPSRPLPQPAAMYTPRDMSEKGMSEHSRGMSEYSRGMSDYRQPTVGSGMEPAPDYEYEYGTRYGEQADPQYGGSQYGDPQYGDQQYGDQQYADEDEYGDEDVEVESDNEHMTVAPMGDSGIYEQEPGKTKGKAKAFVGGFIKRLPRIMQKNRLRRRVLEKKGGGAGPAAMRGQSSTPLPRYDDPGQPVPDPTNVQYVEGMEMPREQRASEALSYVDPPSRPISIVRRPSGQVSYLERYQDRRSDDGPLENPYDPPGSIGTPANLGTPVLANPLPTVDYQKMEPPVRFHPQDDSFSAHINRVAQFLHQLKDLPWTSSRIVDDFEPGKSRRARFSGNKPQGSWYSAHKERVELDLLASSRSHLPIGVPYAPSSAQSAFISRPPPPQSLSTGRSPSPAYSPVAGTPPATRATRTGGRPPHSPPSPPVSSPGASSGGKGPKSYSYNYYFAPPQPLYVYSNNNTPQGSPTPTQANPPVYMVPGPAQVVIPTQPASPVAPVPASPIVTPPSPGAPGMHRVAHAPTVTQYPRTSGSSQGHLNGRLSPA
ncbi:hypothetical protein OBBRIDRAFT_336615 [Obba rivulosa]|uniref:Uncharacterized protein n=1 Tax=Obba rivulosa TaxID=1052685 RepID=A0A8E2AQZ9_9APHY|nr:hypothetical protein OBBRIDRAFT_336615 [Obba rivulosa]